MPQRNRWQDGDAAALDEFDPRHAAGGPAIWSRRSRGLMAATRFADRPVVRVYSEFEKGGYSSLRTA
jgi:hypothetical protein